LIQADAKWGGTYLTQAQTLITNIKVHETNPCGSLLVLKPGDAWGECTDTNPSYFTPAYYRIFAKVNPGEADHWNLLVEDTYKMIATNQTAMNGLLSDWCSTTGSPTNASYGYEACRTPWRFATDFAWTGNEDARSVLEGLHNANAGANGDSNSCFRGGYALTSIISDQATFDAAVNTWLTTTEYDNAYYQTTLRNLYLLVAGGKFSSAGRL
jgi:endo-1,4-beta-D-glucanase Y